MNSTIAGQKPHYFISLDSLRGLCAMIVSIYHFPSLNSAFNNPFFYHGDLFVDFFFVLSGFVIAANYSAVMATAKAAGRFMWLRIGRLYPLHLLMLGAYIGVELVQAAVEIATAGEMSTAFTGRQQPEAILSNIALVHAWGFHKEVTWNVPSWTISTEMFAYILFGIITVLTKQAKWIVYGIVAISSAFILYVFNDGELRLFSHLGYFLARCSMSFFAGALVWKLWNHLHTLSQSHEPFKGMGHLAFSVIELATLVMIAVFVWHAGSGALTFAAPLVFGIAVLVFAFDRGVFSQLLQAPVLVFLGTLSYEYYLTHQFIIDRMMNAALGMEKIFNIKLHIERPNGDFAFDVPYIGSEILVLVMFLITLSFSHVCYTRLSNPARRWFRAHTPEALKRDESPAKITN